MRFIMKLHNKHIVLATHNAGKVPEISSLLSPYGCTITTAKDYNVSEPIENGKTFSENALIKARHTAKITNQISLSDDSGLCISALNNKPGIHSARYAGEHKDFYSAMMKLEEEMSGLYDTSAHFTCALAIVFPTGEEKVFEGYIHGNMSFPPKGTKGFGYDPIFIPKGYSKTFAEFEPKDKHTISHRAEAFKHLVKYFF